MTWRKVADLDAVASGSMAVFVVDGIELLVVRGKEHTLVIPPVCPHMSSALLDDGLFDGCTLTCTTHLWQFSVADGGAPIGLAEAPLLTYESKEMDGAVYVNLVQELKYPHQSEDSD